MKFPLVNALIHFGDQQTDIYASDLRGCLAKLPLDFAGLEPRAHAAMPPCLVSHFAGGRGSELTRGLNVAAFERRDLRSGILAGAAMRDLSIELLGMKLTVPLYMAPIGVIASCAQDGRGGIAVARAAIESTT